MRLRVLVTGSRELSNPDLVKADLLNLMSADGLNVLTVVHGNCPTGADRAAKEWCEEIRGYTAFMGIDVIEEPHDAAWNAYGKAAGPMRNTEMVDLGADMCLAYPQGKSAGTRDCMKKAEAAGIMVVDRSA